MLFIKNNTHLLVNSCVYIYKKDGSKIKLKDHATEQDFYAKEIKSIEGHTYKQICLQCFNAKKSKFVYVGYVEDGVEDVIAHEDFNKDMTLVVEIINRFSSIREI